MLSILSMNTSLSSNSTELTLTQITRSKTASVTDVIHYDMSKMGYNRLGKTSPILEYANSEKIQFQSNIDNSTDNSVELITWEFTDQPVTTTKNPNDYILKRTVKDLDTGTESVTEIKLGVTHFNIKYYDTYGAPLSNNMSTPISSSKFGDVKQLYIELELQSGEKVYKRAGGEGRYVRSIWEKRYSPSNLESN